MNKKKEEEEEEEEEEDEVSFANLFTDVFEVSILAHALICFTEEGIERLVAGANV